MSHDKSTLGKQNLQPQFDKILVEKHKFHTSEKKN